MSYWRLTVRRAVGVDEVIDLRMSRAVFAGDRDSNDICIDTTLVPSRLRVVSQLFGKVFIRLTDEVAGSIQGEFKKNKSWHSGLFSGHLYEAHGTVRWTIGDAQFFLEKVENVPLIILKPQDRSIEIKQMFQSLVGSLGSHAVLGLLLFLFALVTKNDSRPISVDSIQKIAIADVNKILEEPKPEPISAAEVEAKVDESTANSAGLAKSQDVAIVKPKPMAQKGKPVLKPSVESMGLLGLQKNTAPKKSNLDVVALASSASDQSKRKADSRVEFGIADASGELNMLAQPSTEQVAVLGSSGIQSYQGGLSDKISKGTKRSASIRLVKREIEIRGGLDPAVIRQIVEERLLEVQICYETALLDKTTLEGKISATWTIAQDGSVKDFRTDSDEIIRDILHPCIAGQIKKWKFPAPKGGGVVHVKYPFLFNPVGS